MSWQAVARRAARRAGVSDPEAFVRQMGLEAHGQDLTSPAGAQGPAQITPATARTWGLSPAQVHNLGAAYSAAATHVAAYERQFGSLRDALVAYNAGPGAVGKPLPAETQNYLRTILGAGDTARVPEIPSSTNGTRAGSIASGRTVSQPVFDQAGFQEAQRRQLLATFLQKQGQGNSILFKSGLLSTAPVDPTQYQGSERVAAPGAAAARVPQASRTALASAPTGRGLQAAVAAATRQLGAITENTGSNRGTRLDKLEGSYGMIGQPWCGMFAGMVLKQAGVRGIGPWIASVAAIETHARAGQGPFAGFTQGGRTARPGDLVIPARGEHVAVVTSVHNGVISVIGGNNSSGTVGRAQYNANSVYGIAHVRY